VLSTRVLDTSIGLVAVDLVDGHVHEITVAGEGGLESLGGADLEPGFERREEALVAALVRVGLPEFEARASADEVLRDWSGRRPSSAATLPLAASSLAPAGFLLAVFGVGFVALGALIWFFLAQL
jgi:hypothetical protein